MKARWLLPVLAAVAVLWQAPPAGAHPLGNFTVNTHAGLVLTPGELRVDYVVDMAEIPTFQELPAIDADGDGRAGAGELAAWAARTAGRLAERLEVRLGEREVALVVTGARAELRPGQGGLSTLRLEATMAADLPSTGRLAFRDGNFPGRLGWREVTAIGAEGVALRASTVPETSPSDVLRAYPSDLLSGPPAVTTAAVGFAPGAWAPAPSGSGPPAAPAPGGLGALATRSVGGPGAVAASLLLAAAFGAAHALAPGHGKALTAAYLVGTGARLRHAAGAGLSVAAMHTASVLALGVALTWAERTFPAERVYPWLGLAAGVVALGLGGALLVSRRAGTGSSGRAHPHPHPHGPSRPGSVALALAGGILPSPSALIVLLGSVALGRPVLGLALVVAFGLGLAACLTAIGALALRVRGAAGRRLPARVLRLVPVLSAAAIVVVGAILTARGAAQL